MQIREVIGITEAEFEQLAEKEGRLLSQGEIKIQGMAKCLRQWCIGAVP
jgi:hypothetical protein